MEGMVGDRPIPQDMAEEARLPGLRGRRQVRAEVLRAVEAAAAYRSGTASTASSSAPLDRSTAFASDSSPETHRDISR